MILAKEDCVARWINGLKEEQRNLEYKDKYKKEWLYEISDKIIRQANAKLRDEWARYGRQIKVYSCRPTVPNILIC